MLRAFRWHLGQGGMSNACASDILPPCPKHVTLSSFVGVVGWRASGGGVEEYQVHLDLIHFPTMVTLGSFCGQLVTFAGTSKHLGISGSTGN